MASSHTHRSDEANSRWDYLSSDVKNKLSFMDPNGMFIVCMCCQLFGRVSDKSTKNLEKECGSIKLRHPFLVTDRWKDHTNNLTHIASEKKYQQMLDDEKEPDSKKRKNPIPSAIASPRITNFFAHKKKKKLDNAEKYNNPIVPKIKSNDTQCNGIFSLHEVLNTNAKYYR